MKEQNSKQIFSLSIDSRKKIKFTPREIDILACLLGTKTAKKIAFILSLSPKTVENYTHNIMQKLNFNSQKDIKDLLQSCNEITFFKQRYLGLLFHATFGQKLKELSSQNLISLQVSKLIYWQMETPPSPLFSQLEKLLNLAGVKICIEAREGACTMAYLIKEVESSADEELQLFNVPQHLKKSIDVNQDVLSSNISQEDLNAEELLILLVKGKGKILLNFFGVHSCEPEEQKNSYLCLLEILKSVSPQHNFEHFFVLIKEHYGKRSLVNSPMFLNKGSDQNKKIRKKYLGQILTDRKWQFSFLSFLFISLFVFSKFIVLNKENSNGKNIEYQTGLSIQSNLVLLPEAALLDRSILIRQIDKKFKGQDNIKTIAIVGIEGAGKTTLARQYAQKKKANVIWEINGETSDRLNESFEKLGAILSKTDQERRDLKAIQEVKDFQERGKKLVQLVKSRLKVISNWFLIFDNVENFRDIQDYFPQDAQNW